jgi:CRP-like cAMP-binding protein
MTMLELSADFGIEESRGRLIAVPFTNRDIADLVGASRPRITEQLARLEDEHHIIRAGRRWVVRADGLRNTIDAATLL